MTSDPALRIAVPRSRPDERRYVVDLIFNGWLGIDHELHFEQRDDVSIRRVGDPGDRAVNVPDGLLGYDDSLWLQVESMPRPPIAVLATPPLEGREGHSGPSFEGLPYALTVPALYGASPGDAHAVRPRPTGLDLTFDLFGSVFFMVSRYEELVVASRDAHGRFEAASSIVSTAGAIERPIVDEMVDLLYAVLHSVWPALQRRPTEYQLRVTHDMDQPWATWRRRPSRVLRNAAADVMVRKRPRLALQRLLAFADSRRGRLDRDPYDTFETLMATSEQNGVSSTFFVLSGAEPGEPDFRYRETDVPVMSLLRRIAERGHEIGLHASYASASSALRLAREVESLRRLGESIGITQTAWGVRQHYLRIDCPSTWVHQVAAGLTYDSSLAYAERSGFRGGTSRDFPVFDLLASTQLGLIERPLTIMDATLTEYMGMSIDDAVAEMRRVVEVCRRHGSPATILIHNHALPVFGFDSVYRDLIAELAR